MFLCDWTGAGIYWDSQGTQKDIKERKGEPSYFRVGKRRGTKTAFAGTSENPSSIVAGGIGLMGLMDLNGQGMICAAKSGEGKVIIYAAKKNGEIGPNIILDAKEDSIYFTAGDGNVQMILDGKKETIRTSRQIILEIIPIPVKEFISKLLEKVRETFKKYHATSLKDLGQMQPFPKDVV